MATIEMNAPLDLSLYHLETGLAELVEYRQSRLVDQESPADTEEVAAIDAEIQRYQIATPAKVTGVVAVFRRWKSQREAATAEIRRLQQIVAHIDCMDGWLKDKYLKPILERLPEPKKGCRKLTGADGSTIILKGNGGLAPLVIADESLLPDQCCRMEGWVRADMWAYVAPWADPDDYSMKRVPDNAAIRAKLAEPCDRCGGMGIREASQFDPHGNGMGGSCETCGGTGKAAVPGAWLSERSQHIEVK